MNLPRILALLLIASRASGATPLETGEPADASALREPVHPRRNVENFAPAEARFVRFTIDQSIGGQPGIDELEIYGPEQPERNLALAENGVRLSASGTLPDYPIHVLRHLNDGVYGNSHSWIANSNSAWVELEFPQPIRIHRIVWGRDRLGKFADRLASVYRFDVALDRGQWKTVATSADRKPIETAGLPFHPFRVNDLMQTTGELPPPAGPASREYLLETWRRAQGLPTNSVTAIAQTPDRWLWVGTAAGLVRFDGMQFTAPEDATLQSARITCLHVDREGALWVGTAGAGLFRRKMGGFTAVREGFPELTVLTLGENVGGQVWAGTTGGLYAFHGGTFQRRSRERVARIARDETSDGIWFLRGQQLMRWVAGEVTAPDPVLEPSRFSSLAALAVAPDGALWFGGGNEYCARYQDGTVTTFAEGHPLFSTPLWVILPAAGGDVWLGTTGSGLARLRDREVLAFRADDGLTSNSIAALCQDSEGNIWVGGNDGLTRVSPRRCTAVTINDGLSHSVVTSLAEDHAGRVWVGTNGGGINHWHQGRALPFAPTYVLDNEIIAALLPGPENAMWAGTMRSGLVLMRQGQTKFFTKAHGLPENSVTALCEDGAGGWWIGTPSSGVAHYQQGAIVVPPTVAALQRERITAIVVEKTGAVWFGLDSGVARLQSGTLTRLSTTEGLAGLSVYTLRIDDAGTLWAGTNRGLSRWRDGRFESFSSIHGLPSAEVLQILASGAHLWLGTNRGIVRVPLRSFESVTAGQTSRLEVLPLDKSHGLPSLECTVGFHPAGLRLRDGRLCFGTVGGLAVVDPANFATPWGPPPVFIERAAGVDDSRGASFRFTALAYAAPQRLRFSYRLEGLENDFHDAGPERTADYAFLPPGAYRFQVRASLDGGPAGLTEVAFEIPTPWWRTSWALAGALLAGVAAVALSVRFITRRRLKRRLRVLEQKLALERERTRIARDIHDQLGANLTHIALLSAGEHEALPAGERERFRAIAASSNELVQAVDAIVWAVNPRQGNLESLARYLSRFADDFLSAAAVRLRLDVPLELPEVQLSPELRHNVFLAAREVLNNSVRHAKATEVQVGLQAANGHFTIFIADNGCGFEPSSAPQGDGLDNIRRRLEECGGTCAIDSAPGRGTTVTFRIPTHL